MRTENNIAAPTYDSICERITARSGELEQRRRNTGTSIYDAGTMAAQGFWHDLRVSVASVRDDPARDGAAVAALAIAVAMQLRQANTEVDVGTRVLTDSSRVIAKRDAVQHESRIALDMLANWGDTFQ